jgi:hypothetical protein
MHARAADRVVIRRHRISEPKRDCEVLEARGPDDTAPFVGRWGDTGQESLFFPGPDASVSEPER